ncbi:MAG: thiamine pyrophosphate-binding protein [SAR202 cluster bacterium]|nr:thiamine pyrophosphate-binding protein [SAR202 cluster bacterium]
MRGADVVIKTLKSLGVERIFALSGNQIMSLFDACIDAGVSIVHVRHEAAAMHMADGWGRLTGQPGVAMVTAGPGMANAVSAMYGAMMAESPCIILTGHASLAQLGKGAFQEMAQAEIASHVCKASWTAQSGPGLAEDMTRAFAIASAGRPGPVHISLPFDFLEKPVEGIKEPGPLPYNLMQSPGPLKEREAASILDALETARRPIMIAGPAMMRGRARDEVKSLSHRTRIPVAFMESPRGVNDPSLGGLAGVLQKADTVFVVGKKVDYTMRFGQPPAFAADASFIQLDAEEESIKQTKRQFADASRVAQAYAADPLKSTELLLKLAKEREWDYGSWTEHTKAALAHRPPEWKALASPPTGPLYAAELCYAVQEFLTGEQDVFISDGGEFGQWAQACMTAPVRVINGIAGSIGSAIPLAIAARVAHPKSRIVIFLGDGTAGFHALEMDTALRYGLPFVAIVGNDAAWGAEYQIQLRSYGKGRLYECELLPTRYDKIATAMGCHGERVSTFADLRPALERAFDSGLPSLLNVDIRRDAAPAAPSHG